jgi:peptidoglycan/xylan/chitin deacetylase (PgdA/CDA1 family)
MGAKATFFLVGENAEKYPEIVERMISEGHEVGCHSHTHLRLSEHSLGVVLADLQHSDNALAKLGASTQLFRPPYGNMPWQYLPALWKHNKKIIFWSIDSRDFELESADQVLERVDFRRVVSGDILLFHDCHQSTVDALPEVGRLANNAGLEMVTISSLIKG